MAEVKKDRKFWVGRVLLVVLFVLSGWLYYQLDLNYRNLETTNRAVETMAAQQAILTKQYAAEVVASKKKVAEAEQLIAQLKQEKDVLQQEKIALEQKNDVLEEKVKLLDKMAELEANIADMKAKNIQLLAEIDRLEREALLHPEKVKSLDEGKTMMTKFRQRMRNLDRRISEIKHDMFIAKVDAQKELDKKRSLAGNNGYLIRNGMAMPQEIILTTENANIKVDVEFVK